MSESRGEERAPLPIALVSSARRLDLSFPSWLPGSSSAGSCSALFLGRIGLTDAGIENASISTDWKGSGGKREAPTNMQPLVDILLNLALQLFTLLDLRPSLLVLLGFLFADIALCVLPPDLRLVFVGPLLVKRRFPMLRSRRERQILRGARMEKVAQGKRQSEERERGRGRLTACTIFSRSCFTSLFSRFRSCFFFSSSSASFLS